MKTIHNVNDHIHSDSTKNDWSGLQLRGTQVECTYYHSIIIYLKMHSRKILNKSCKSELKIELNLPKCRLQIIIYIQLMLSLLSQYHYK